MILSSHSAPTRSRRAVTSVSVTSAIAIAVVLAGCSSSSGSGKTPPPTAPAASTRAASTPAASAPAVSAPVSDTAAPSVPAAPAAPPSGSPADPATKTAVTTAYESFFTPATKPAVAKAELQNGAVFTSSLAALAKTAKAQKTSVKVTAVSVAGPVATVTFTLYGGKTALLPDTHGYAVLTNGKWQVAAQTFCALVGLQPPAPAACKDPKNTALPH